MWIVVPVFLALRFMDGCFDGLRPTKSRQS